MFVYTVQYIYYSSYYTVKKVSECRGEQQQQLNLRLFTAIAGNCPWFK